MHEMGNGEVAFGEHLGNVFQMHLDGADLVGVLGVVGRDLHYAAVRHEDEMVSRTCLTEIHASVGLTALYNARVMIVGLGHQDGGDKQEKSQRSVFHGRLQE